jgi:hypothetical protein
LRARANLVPSWPLLIAAAALLRVLGDPQSVLRDPDTYLHVAVGRWIIGHLALPLRDPFSSTMPGAIWIPHEWLSEVVMAVVYRLAGWNGLVLLTGALFACTMGFLTRRLLRHGEPLTTVILALSIAALLLPHVIARPHLLALPIMALWSAALIEARDARRHPPCWALPLMTLWANLHGGFMAGMALAVYLAAEAVILPGGRSRQSEALTWGGFVLLSTAAALLTPMGLAGFLQPFRLAFMSTMQGAVVEWLRPEIVAFQPQEIWLLGAIFVGFATGARLPLSRLLLLLALFHLWLQHARYADLLAAIGPIAVFASLGPQIAARVRAEPPSALARLAGRLAKPASPAIVALAILASAVVAIVVLLRPLPREDSDITPDAALAAARRMELSGPVFNSEGFAGYLVFNGVPTYIDGRFEMYGDGFLSRYLEAIDGREPALTEALEGHGVTWTLLAPQDGAVAVLDHRPGWRRVYADRTAVIHAHRSGGEAP